MSGVDGVPRQGLARRRVLAAVALGALCPCRLAQAQARDGAAAGAPRSLSFIVPFSAGSGPDAVVRALAREVGAAAGVTVIVDNRPGASSVLAAQAVARALPDGATVLITGNVAFTGNPHVMKQLPYDPVADFTPVAGIARGPMVLYVNPEALPARGVAELLALLKREPGRYSYGYTSITSRLPAEVLQQAAGVKLVGVPYRSGAAALPDLVSGRIQLLFTDFSAAPHAAAGRLRAIAVTELAGRGAGRTPGARVRALGTHRARRRHRSRVGRCLPACWPAYQYKPDGSVQSKRLHCESDSDIRTTGRRP